MNVTRNLRCAAAAVALMGLVCAWPTQAFAVEHIPFKDVDGGLIQVQASVDGRPAIPMLVDLGAGVDVLSQRVGRSLVAIDGKYASLRLTGERVDLPIGTVLSLALAGIPVVAPHVGIWKGLDGTGVDGLVAATAFRNIVTTFDFPNHRLIVEDAASFPERVRTAARIPLILQDDLDISLGLFARFDFGNGKTGLCEIDTGSQGLTIDKTFAAGLGVNLNDPQLKHTHSASGDRVAATIPSIALIGAPQTTISHPAATFADLIYDCNVGNSFWDGRSFTLDLPHRVMYVSTPT